MFKEPSQCRAAFVGVARPPLTDREPLSRPSIDPDTASVAACRVDVYALGKLFQTEKPSRLRRIYKSKPAAARFSPHRIERHHSSYRSQK